jgi:hypothetical protein
MHRRRFLRGLGGALVAAPFLSSVWERETKGQAVAPNPRQLIVMFTHYGCVTTKWFPVKSHGPLVAGDLANSLAPLAPYAGKLLIPRGIRAMNEWTQNNSGGAGHGLGQGNDPHVQASASYFTLQPITPNSNDAFSFSQSWLFSSKPVGSSLDHVIAQQLSPSGTPLLMRVGNSGGSAGETASSAVSYLKDPSAAASDPANIFPGLGTPSQIFSMLTGLFDKPTSPSPDTYASTRGKRISDLVRTELQSFRRTDMSADDRRKLDAWESLLNEVGTVVSNANQCTTDLATKLGATQTNVSAVGAGGLNKDTLTSMVTDTLDGADMYSVMAVLSAVCHFNPVIFLKYPPNYVFSGLNITVEAEGLSHRTGSGNMTGPCVASVLSMLQTIDTYYATKFARLVGMLDGIQNGDGSTLLDNTATVWFQEMSDGGAHNLNNLPIIQAGGCGGYFRTGWTINVDTTNTGSATLTQGNSEAQCTDGTANGQVNDLTQATGTPTAMASAPINKYYYALMNALGVKGDDNGYPSKTGTGPVTRFGYSDLTTDFCGGLGAVPGATIHSPGEFTALKA